jgi:hypothetical protein
MPLSQDVRSVSMFIVLLHNVSKMSQARGLPAIIVAVVSLTAVVTVGALAAHLIGLARWRVPHIAFWVVVVWLGILLALSCYKRVTK